MITVSVAAMFTPGDVSSIVEESLKMKNLKHPNVLNLIGVSVDAGPSPYIVMPYMTHGSLLTFLKKERPRLTIVEDTSDSELVS